ncbi:MAG: metal-dependent hydrolase, partial [Proteobacteria bacterium]|nr:metal-dependent hydrolase [Pseudomonadota bacterium]
MILAHSLIGVPITHYLIKNKSEFYDKPLFTNLMYGVGIVAAVFPDFDLILSFFINDLDHRKLISHSIVPYLVVFCFGILLSKLFSKYSSEIKILNLIFFIGVLSHLFLDA